MRIHDYPAFPNPARVRIALHEKGAFDAVEFVEVDVPGGAHRTDAFRAMNPSMAVPVLELDDGTFVTECTAITEYLDAALDGPVLTGRTARGRASIHMMQRRAEQYVMDAVGAYFHHATDGLGPEIEGEQCPKWGRRQRAVAERGLVHFDELLATRPYLSGDAYSMADITLFAGLAFAEFAGIEVPERLGHLAGWRARVASRPAVAAALGG